MSFPATAVPQSTSPTVVPQSTSPTVVPQSTSPTVVPQSTSPTVVPQSTSPTVVPQSTSPTVVPQSTSPTVVPQSTSTTAVPQTTSTIQPTIATSRKSPQYKAVLSHLEKLTTTLTVTPGSEGSLLLKFQELSWLAIGAVATAQELVTLALNRIETDVRDYEVFINMLKDTAGMEQVVKMIAGILDGSSINSPAQHGVPPPQFAVTPPQHSVQSIPCEWQLAHLSPSMVVL